MEREKGSGESAQNPFNAIIDTENVPPSFQQGDGFHKAFRKNENHRNCIFRLDSFVGFLSLPLQKAHTNVWCGVVGVCVCLFCHLRVSLLMRPKKLVFIVTQGEKAGSLVGWQDGRMAGRQAVPVLSY